MRATDRARHRAFGAAIERPDGVLVERLIKAGLTVLAIHRNHVAAARERYVTAGKNDRLDAFVLAELARTDAHRFHAICADSDATKALRVLTPARLQTFLKKHSYSGRRDPVDLLERLHSAPGGTAGPIELDPEENRRGQAAQAPRRRQAEDRVGGPLRRPQAGRGRATSRRLGDVDRQVEGAVPARRPAGPCDRLEHRQADRSRGAAGG